MRPSSPDFHIAERKRGITGENLLALLETRLDNAVYRLGLAQSRPQARQLVRHGHFTVNGKKVSIPSIPGSPGRRDSRQAVFQEHEQFKAIAESAPPTVPAWLSLGDDRLSGKVLSVPTRDQIDLDIQEQLIVELSPSNAGRNGRKVLSTL